VEGQDQSGGEEKKEMMRSGMKRPFWKTAWALKAD
jgi:hypothetical protein